MGSMAVPEIPTGDFRPPQDVVEPETQLRDDIGSYSLDPVGLTKYIFPWGLGQLEKYSGPRTWQGETLQIIKDHLADEATRYQPLQLAVASGHGIGKTALIAMIMKWAQSTCEDCKIVCTAGTGTQLSTKTVPEVQKWFRLAINSHWWDINATSIRVKDENHQAMWRTDFITWSLQKTEAFAGLHNIGKRIVLIFDEASAIADQIWEVAEGALTDENTEIIWIAFGNPTRNNGKFYEAITGANRWKKRQIDSRQVEGTNKALLEAQIKEWGEDSDRARVRIRGEFPRGGSTQFISGELVALARKRKVEAYESSPKIISVDVARFGDDRSIIGKRQGRKADILGKYYGVDTQKLGSLVIEAIDREKPDACVIDGDGIGGAVFDYVKARGYDRKTLLVEFHGGAAPSDPHKYLNKRAEIWGDMRDWLETASIPDDPEVDTDITGPDYGYHPTKQCIVLESKDEMKSRGVASPDIGDMLAMTFGVKVLPKTPEALPETIYGGEMAQGWMRALIPLVYLPMAARAKPLHIKPEFLLVTLVMVGLYLSGSVALGAFRWARKKSVPDSNNYSPVGFSYARVSLMHPLLVIRRCIRIIVSRAPIYLSPLFKILGIPFAGISSAVLSPSNSRSNAIRRLLPRPHICSLLSSLLFNSHTRSI